MAGRTILFGTIRCSRSTAEIATSTAQKNAARAALRREPESENARDHKQCGHELDRRVAQRDPRRAVAAAAAQERVRDERDVVARGDLGVAAHAGRGGLYDRAAKRHAGGDDVQEAPEREPGSESDSGEGELHPRLLSAGTASG